MRIRQVDTLPPSYDLDKNIAWRPHGKYAFHHSIMAKQRHFIGWNRPVTERTAEFLLGSAPPERTPDLTDTLVIVPTRQANRRFRESLALHASAGNTGLLAPRVMTPHVFLQNDSSPDIKAGQLQILTAWISVFQKCDIRKFSALFPEARPTRDFDWAAGVSELLIRLRQTLAEGGYQINDVIRLQGINLDEPDRWNELAQLETLYLAELRKSGVSDPDERMIGYARDPSLPEDIQRIVIAAVPDPAPLFIEAMEKISKTREIDILIHAPADISELFDQWGQPVPDLWTDISMDIPELERNLIVAGTPADQSRSTLSLMAGETGRFGPADVAIGVPDRRLIPLITDNMAESGIPAHDPAGRLLNKHPLFQLLSHWHDVVRSGDYESIRRFIRHPDILKHLETAHGVKPDALLDELDRFHNDHLPSTMVQLAELCGTARERELSLTRTYRHLPAAMSFVMERLKQHERSATEDSLRDFLQVVYQGRFLDTRRSEDEEFIAAARELDSVLSGLSDAGLETHLDSSQVFNLCLRHAGRLKYYPERKNGAIDLEGWLELQWNDAPFMMITGMNDGIVPDGRLSDIFLPDSLRHKLRIRTDTDRLARDAYLMRAIIESRRQSGRVCFIVGRTNREGDPARPSRLLFLCEDSEILRRAKHLFSETGEPGENIPASISFKLDARPPPGIDPANLNIHRLRVTQFRDYLNCPFRFYLGHILGMEPMESLKKEMDALDFGSGIHHALRMATESGSMNNADDPGKLGGLLGAELNRWSRERFGHRPPLQILMQMEAARRRLMAAAHEQVKLLQEGWRIINSEQDYEMTWSGFTIRGRIDRIDRNEKTGALRVIDYKTSDRKTPPIEDHLGSPGVNTPDYTLMDNGQRIRRWSNLQLPLYIILLQSNGLDADSIDTGYFSLPKAVTESGLYLWSGFDEAVITSARKCAEGVMDHIRRRVFWPPADKVDYDDFEHIFYGNPGDFIDEKSFMDYLNNA